LGNEANRQFSINRNFRRCASREHKVNVILKKG
jgi:hypothetical protein